MDSANAAVARFPPRALRVVTCCLIIHTLIIRAAVTILPGVSAAVRLRPIDMLEREPGGYCVIIRASRAASSASVFRG